MRDLIGSRLKQNLFVTIQRGSDWLVRRQKPDGGFRYAGNELGAYYKSLLLFAGGGWLEPAVVCLRYIKKDLQNKNGELCSGSSKTGFPRMQRNLANYMDGWVAIGAWLLGDYEFADLICLRLTEQQCESHGGVSTGLAKWSGRLRYDLATAASCGRSFLITGHRDAAFASADFLAEALRHQRDLTRGLHLSFDFQWNRIASPTPSEDSYYWLDSSSRGQKVWFPAFACGFLCEVFQVTRERSYLKAAEQYFNVIVSIPEFGYGTLANGKSGWAAASLALCTREKRYIEVAQLIIPSVLARQKEDGEFGPSPRLLRARKTVLGSEGGRTPDMPISRRIETTAEFTYWSLQYLRLNTLGL